jgi:dolichyl-phosphate beta-glucosyltransferase
MTASIDYSLIIPAYNEAGRLPCYLPSIKPYLDSLYMDSYEVIVVDDGSRDGLAAFLESLCAEWPQLSLIRHLENQGKGAAVRRGMLSARGDVILFADADGATPIAEEKKLRDAIDRGAAVAVGDRLLRPGKAVQRSWHRGVLGKAFASLTRRFFDLPVLDTQCGFKMFRREAGLRLARLCHRPDYLFDVEILLWAQRLGYHIAEVPVAWRDVPGSKVHPIRDGWTMLRGLFDLHRSFRTAAPQSLAGVDVERSILAASSPHSLTNHEREMLQQPYRANTKPL